MKQIASERRVRQNRTCRRCGVHNVNEIAPIYTTVTNFSDTLMDIHTTILFITKLTSNGCDSVYIFRVLLRTGYTGDVLSYLGFGRELSTTLFMRELV